MRDPLPVNRASLTRSEIKQIVEGVIQGEVSTSGPSPTALLMTQIPDHLKHISTQQRCRYCRSIDLHDIECFRATICWCCSSG